MSEWSGWAVASNQAAVVCTNYVVGKKDNSFDPLHRRAEMYANLKADGFLVEGGVKNLPLANPKAQIEAAASEVFQYVLNGFEALIGVPNKGYAILLEIAEHLKLPKSMVHNLNELEPAELVGKRAVLFDDTIHLGRSLPEVAEVLRGQKLKTCVAMVLWASKDGLKIVKPQVSDVFSTIEGRRVEEQHFGFIFQLEVSPMIYCLRAGAVAHRPSKTLNISHDNLDQDSLAAAILVNLANAESPTNFFEPPPQDGVPSETFHGTLEFWDGGVLKQLEHQIEGRADSIEYAKVRVFIFPTDNGFRVHLAAIVCAEGIKPQFRAEELDEELSGSLLNRVVGAFELIMHAGRFKVHSP
jgi:hypothetical protein